MRRDSPLITLSPSHFVTLSITWLTILALAGPARAQDYSFSVPVMRMQVHVQPDASARIVYDISFTNNPGAHTIDVVDIGTPHERYDISNMRASVNEVQLSGIRPSQYVKPGVEVHLGSHSISAGAQGTFHFEFIMPDMVYQDTTRSEYASLQITPTWFGPQYVTGRTHLGIAVHMLPGIKPDEVLHQAVPFTNKAVDGDRVIVVWQWPDTRVTGPERVGVSFPKRGMSRVVHITKLDLLLKWFKENPSARMWAGLAFFLPFTFFFFRFSGGTGWSVFLVLSAGIAALFFASPEAHLIAFLPLIVFAFLSERHQRSRRSEYLPAIAQVEGGGIKRGLTAPEAAVLLELPLNKVLTLVIFGMLKKGMLRQVQASPLVVEVDPAFSRNPAKGHLLRRRMMAQDRGIVLHSYEGEFLDRIEENSGKPVSEIDFGAPMKELIEESAKRVAGFDLSDTQDYYRSIIRRALQQAREIGDIQQREKVLDHQFEWILLDDRYPTVFRTGTYDYEPSWTRSRGGGGGIGSFGVPSSGPPSSGGRTTLGDVGGSFAGWAENVMGSMASAISPGSLNVSTPSAGVVNLGGFDHVTSDIFEALAKAAASGGGGRGGGGGGCACACAGCACACACAGGGR